VILKEWAIPSIGGDKFFIRLTGKLEGNEKGGVALQATPPQFRLAVGPPYRSKNFCRSSCFEVVCITSIARILAFCGGRLSAITAPASLSIFPPPRYP